MRQPIDNAMLNLYARRAMLKKMEREKKKKKKNNKQKRKHSASLSSRCAAFSSILFFGQPPCHACPHLAYLAQPSATAVV